MASPLLFLSHSGEDTELAKELARALRSAGLRVWIDVDELHPGDKWMESLENALREASAFAVLIGVRGVQHFVDREVRTALVRNTADPAFRIIPLLGPGADPKALPAFLVQHQWVDLRAGVAEPEALKRFASALLDVPAKSVSLLPPGESPFRGLLAFDVEHAQLFFGRDAEIDQLLENLRRGRLLSVVGDSGCGKSSLVRAGLIPALHRGRFHDGGEWVRSWKIAILRPGADPFWSAASALLDLDATLDGEKRIRARAATVEQLASGTSGLASCIAALAPRDAHVLLVVDQFEELFTQVADEQVRARFIDSVLCAADVQSSPSIHVVITLRADFYKHCWKHPRLPQRIASNQFAVERMQTAQLRETIESPLALAGIGLEEGLANTILADVGDEPGSLALLEHSLYRLWEKRSGATLTHKSYDEIGRLSGALRQHADDFYKRLDPAERSLARTLFEELTQLGEGAEDTRRRVAKGTLVALDPEQKLSAKLLERLVGARLLTASREATVVDAPGAEPVEWLEISHEALIREWPLFRRWLDEDREAIRTARKFVEAAEEWRSHDADPSYLYAGARLAQAEEWASRRPGGLTPELAPFLVASIEERDRSVRAADEQRKRQLELAESLAAEQKQRADLAQRSRRKTERLLLIVGALFLLALGAGLFAWFKRAESESLSYAARSLQELERNPERALVLAIEAGKRHDNPESWKALDRALHQPRMRGVLGPDIRFSTFSPNGKWLLTIGKDRHAQLLGIERFEPVCTLPESGAFAQSAGFSADSTKLFTLGLDRKLRIFDTSSGRALREESVSVGDEAKLDESIFSEDGRYLLAKDPNDQWRVFDVHQPANSSELTVHYRKEYAAAVTFESVRFSEDGERVLAVCDDHTFRLYDPADGSESTVFGMAESAYAHLDEDDPGTPWNDISVVALSPDHRMIAFASLREGPWVYNAETGDSATSVASKLDSDVTQMAFNPGFQDNSSLAMTFLNGHVELRELIEGGSDADFQGPAGHIQQLRFSKNGKRLLTVGRDGIARFHDTAELLEIAEVREDDDPSTWAEFSPDGSLALTRGRDGTTMVVELDQGSEILTLQSERGKSYHSSFSPDGRRAIALGEYAPARVVDISLGSESTALSKASAYGSFAQLSPDRAKALVVSRNEGLRVFDLASGEPIPLPPQNDCHVMEAAFSPDGRTVLSTQGIGNSMLFDIERGTSTVVVMGAPESEISKPVFLAQFSLDGKWVAACTSFGALHLFEVAKGTLSRTLDVNGGMVSCLDFSRDGRQVLAGLEQGGVIGFDVVSGTRVSSWDSEGVKLVDLAFSPDGKLVATAAQDGRVRLIDPVSGTQVRKLRGNLDSVTHCEFSPDGRLVLTACRDGYLRVYEVSSGSELRVLPVMVYGKPFPYAEFSHDSRSVLLVDPGGAARIYSLVHETLLEQAEARLPVTLTTERRRHLAER